MSQTILQSVPVGEKVGIAFSGGLDTSCTTCGTGSECTNISVAIVKDEKDGVLTGGETKLGLVSDDIIPNKVCLIPELLKTLPYKPFACSAIDALVHATESFLSPHLQIRWKKGIIKPLLQLSVFQQCVYCKI